MSTKRSRVMDVLRQAGRGDKMRARLAANCVLLAVAAGGWSVSGARVGAELVALGLLVQFVLWGSGVLVRRMPRAASAATLAMPVLLAGCMGSCGWGRPLRAQGRQIFPQLRTGSDWTDGARPSRQGLDDATCAALEALWLHDAQKEHASVPAFARISWMLAAVGAPADLMAWAHRAALEEVEHAQRCFALAAGYGGRTHSVEPLPDLLLSGLELSGDPLLTLMRESLEDGCQLEEFNADVAADAARHCEEPVTRAVLEQIAREEASHAALSWALLEWAIGKAPEAGRQALAQAGRQLREVQRPVAVSGHLAAIVAPADAAQMRRHGRVPDARLETLWNRRLAQTALRLEELRATLEPEGRAVARRGHAPASFAASQHEIG